MESSRPLLSLSPPEAVDGGSAKHAAIVDQSTVRKLKSTMTVAEPEAMKREVNSGMFLRVDTVRCRRNP